jgi:hypothetical protein
MTSTDKIRRAIRLAANAKKNIADVASINFYLGLGEKIDQATLDAHHLAAREIPPLPTAAPEPAVDDFGAPVEPINGSGAHIEQVEQVEPVEPEALQVAVTPEPASEMSPVEPLSKEGQVEQPAVLTGADARRAVTESQIRLRSSVDRQSKARQRLGRALAGWQRANGVIVTDEDNRRAHLASEAQLRADRKAGLIPPRGSSRVLQSRVDQIAAATAGADYGKGAGTFSYKRPLLGAKPGEAGFYPATSLAGSQRRLNAILAARPKLPSER